MNNSASAVKSNLNSYSEYKLDRAGISQEIAQDSTRVLDEQLTSSWEKLLGVKNEPLTTQEVVELSQAAETLIAPDQTEATFPSRGEIIFNQEVPEYMLPELSDGEVLEASYNESEDKWQIPGTQVVEVPPAIESTKPEPAFQNPSFVEDDQPPLIDFKMFFDFAGETTTKGITKVVNTVKKYVPEFRKAITNIFSEFVFFKVLTPEQQKKADEKKKKDQEKAKNKADFYAKLRQQQAESVEQKRAKEEQIKATNEKLGINSNFEGSMVNGGLRTDLQQEIARKESEAKKAQEEKEKAQKAKSAQSPKKGKPGQKIDNMDLATEKQSHWSKAIG